LSGWTTSAILQIVQPDNKTYRVPLKGGSPDRTVTMSTATATDRATQQRRARRASYAGMIALASGGMVVFPLYPALQEQLGLSTQALGIVAAAGFVAALIAELVLAPQADHGRARLMALSGITAMALSLFVAAMSTEAWQFVASKALGGVGYGLFFPAVSAVLIRMDPSSAGENLGKLSTAELAGIAVGPFIASALIGITSPMVILAASGGLVLLAMYPMLRYFREDESALDSERPGQPTLAIDLLGHRRVWGAGLLTVAVMVPVGAYDALWPRYMSDLGADELLIGASYVLFALPFMLLAAYAGRLGDRLGGGKAFARGLVVLLAMIVLYGVLTNPWAVTGIGMVESSGQALAFVGAATAMAQAVTVRRAGAAQGLARAMGLIGAAIASAFAGWAYVIGGAQLLFFGTAVIVLLAAIAAWVLLRGRTSGPAIGDEELVDAVGVSTLAAEASTVS